MSVSRSFFRDFVPIACPSDGAPCCCFHRHRGVCSPYRYGTEEFVYQNTLLHSRESFVNTNQKFSTGAKPNAKKRMTNMPPWATCSSLQAIRLTERRKGCSGLNQSNCCFWQLSLLSQSFLSPQKPVDGTVPPGQGEEAATMRGHLFIQDMGTDTDTPAPASFTTDKRGPGPTKPNADLLNQNRLIDK